MDTPPLRDRQVDRERQINKWAEDSRQLLTDSCLWYLDDAWGGLWLVFGVFQDFHWSITDETSSQKHLQQTDRWAVSLWAFYLDRYLIWAHLADQSGVPPVFDVILSDITVQPVTEVQKPVVQWNQDVCDQTCTHRRVTSQTRNQIRKQETS